MRPIWRHTLGVATVAIVAATAAAPTSAFGQDSGAAPAPSSDRQLPKRRTAPPRPSPSSRATKSTSPGRAPARRSSRSSRARTARCRPSRPAGRQGRLRLPRRCRGRAVLRQGGRGALQRHRPRRDGLRRCEHRHRAGHRPLHHRPQQGPLRTGHPQERREGRRLLSIDGIALKADKAKAADFFADATPRPRRVQDREIWLDGKAYATLDQSTKQVNADRAWAGGLKGGGTKVAVLDTGADGEHPDLQGRIVASKDFTGSTGGALSDVHGHGTHTASTVGGSGAASDGAKGRRPRDAAAHRQGAR